MLSLEARDTWTRAYALAGRCDAGGLLVLKGTRLGKDELYNPKIQPRRLELAIEELINKGFFIRHLDGAIEVADWETEQTSKDASRQRKSRDKRRDSVRDSHGESHALKYLELWRSAVTNNVTCHDIEYRDTPPTGVASLTSFGPSPSGGDAAQSAAWPHELIFKATKIRSKAIRDFTREDRYTAGRLHCLLFANCTVQEKSNRANAVKVAAGFAGLATTRDYGDITLAQYVVYASKVHEQRGGDRWFDPWLIKGVVEFETV